MIGDCIKVSPKLLAQGWMDGINKIIDGDPARVARFKAKRLEAIESFRNHRQHFADRVWRKTLKSKVDALGLTESSLKRHKVSYADWIDCAVVVPCKQCKMTPLDPSSSGRMTDPYELPTIKSVSNNPDIFSEKELITLFNERINKVIY